VIPVLAALLAADGTPLGAERLLVLDSPSQTWVFDDVDTAPVPSLLRGFSAPVILDDGLSGESLLVLLAHDSDPFVRWEAGQRLALAQMLPALAHDGPVRLDDGFVEAMRGVLRHPALDSAFKELVLTLPSEAYVAEQVTPIDPQRIHAVREQMRRQLAGQLHDDWAWAFSHHQVSEPYRPTPGQAGRRALANLALSMLCLNAVATGDTVWPGRALQRFKDAGNMTDRLGALGALAASHSPLADAAFERLHRLGRSDALVVDKWFMLQATAPEPLGDGAGRVFARAKALLQHPDFSLRNPNRARSLIFSLCMNNPAAFHRRDAAGYVFWAERLLELDTLNPQVAARLARAMDRWSALAEPYRSAAREAVSRVAAKAELSADVREIIGRALESA
jgi:aminopeptidase N